MIIVGVGISNFVDDEVNKEMANDPKVQAIAKKWEVAANNLLDLCRTSDTSEDTLVRLQNCKTDIRSLSNDCDEQVIYSKTNFCSNTDFQKLDESFDQRITIVEEKIEALQQKVEDLKKQREALESARPEFNEDVFEFANDSVLGYLDYCMEYPSERCTEDAKEMLRLCSIDASVKACSDPRMKEIANWYPNHESTQQNLETKIDYPPHSRDECIPDEVCFVPGDFLKYDNFLGDELYYKNNYTHGGFFDENTIAVHDTAVSIQNGIESSPETYLIEMNLLGGIVIGGQYDILQKSPVNIDRWLKHETSAEYWKDKVVEDSYNYNGFMRKVIVVNIESPSNIIDKETGILLFHQANYYGGINTVKLVDTNIIQASNTDKNQNYLNYPKLSKSIFYDSLKYSKTNSYVDKTHNFSIEPPANWITEVNKDPSTFPVSFYSQNEDRVGFGIQVSEFGKFLYFSEISDTKILEDYKSNFIPTDESIVDFKVDRYLDGFKIKILSSRVLLGSPDSEPILSEKIFFGLNDGRQFIINYGGYQTPFYQNEEEFQKSVNTFSI